MNETTTKAPRTRKPADPRALVTPRMLGLLGACRNGRAAFREHYPQGISIDDTRRLRRAIKVLGSGRVEWLTDALSYRLERINPEVSRVAFDYQNALYAKWISSGGKLVDHESSYVWPWAKYIARLVRRTDLLVNMDAEAVKLGYGS